MKELSDEVERLREMGGGEAEVAKKLESCRSENKVSGAVLLYLWFIHYLLCLSS